MIIILVLTYFFHKKHSLETIIIKKENNFKLYVIMQSESA